MPVKIIVSENSIKAKIDDSWKKGLAMLSSEVLKDCNLYCKMDTGALIASSYVHSKLAEGKLIWQTPYAARQYYAIQTAYKDKNPNASWKWCEKAKRLHVKDWRRQAQRILELYLK